MRSSCIRVSVALALFGLAANAGAEGREEAELAASVEAIRIADYRADLEELRRQADRLAAPTAASLESYRHYWRGFAYWRSALNGFNQALSQVELLADLDRAIAEFEAALALEPGFEDAKSARAGCWMSEMFLASAMPAERRDRVYREGIAAIRDFKEGFDDGNPRSLWILAGYEMGAPPPWGGDLAKAAQLYERALAAARREALGTPGAPWEPRWGGAEALMSLSYLYSQGAAAERDLARAYALGALALVPDWQYVGEILLPSIEALPDANAPVAASASDPLQNND